MPGSLGTNHLHCGFPRHGQQTECQARRQGTSSFNAAPHIEGVSKLDQGRVRVRFRRRVGHKKGVWVGQFCWDVERQATGFTQCCLVAVSAVIRIVDACRCRQSVSPQKTPCECPWPELTAAITQYCWQYVLAAITAVPRYTTKVTMKPSHLLTSSKICVMDITTDHNRWWRSQIIKPSSLYDGCTH